MRSSIDGKPMPTVGEPPTDSPSSMENLIAGIENPLAREDAERMFATLVDLDPAEPTLESLQLEAQIWRLISRHGRGTKEDINRCAAALTFLQGLSRLRSQFMEQEKLEKLKTEVEGLMTEHRILLEVLEQNVNNATLALIKKNVRERMRG